MKQKTWNDRFKALTGKTIAEANNECGELFSSGEWTVYNMSLPARGIIEIHANGKTIATVKKTKTGKIYAAKQDPEAEANASLIVQSKRLYYTLEAFVLGLDSLTDNPIHSSLMKAAKELLSNAAAKP